MRNESFTVSDEATCRRESILFAAASPSLINITHSLIPKRPMHSEFLVNRRSSKENRKISSALTPFRTPSTFFLSKTILIRERLALLRLAIAISLRSCS